MKGIEVKKILQKNGYSLKDIAELMNETPQNFQALLKVEDIKTGVLERIANAIKKDIMFFFREIREQEDFLYDKELNNIIKHKLHYIQFYFASILFHIRNIEELTGGEKFDNKQFKKEENYMGQFEAPFEEPFYKKYSTQEKLDFIKELDEATRYLLDNMFVISRETHHRLYISQKN